MEPQVIQDIIAFCVPQRMAHVPGIVPRRAVQLGMYMVVAWFRDARNQVVFNSNMHDPFDRVSGHHHQQHDGDEDEDDDVYVPRFSDDGWSLADWLTKYPLTRSRTDRPLPMFSTDWLVYECLASDLFEGIQCGNPIVAVSMEKAPESVLVATVLNGAELALEKILNIDRGSRPSA
ncbi:hypothetical protein PINS_up015488 [Pythium insidiosum]|nr:hypothetical protein PINS_up015488 [Pythium insidiosum]